MARFAIFMSPVGLYARERLLLTVAARLIALGHAVDILTPWPEPQLREAMPPGARLVDLGRWWMGRNRPRRRTKRRVYLSLATLIGYLRQSHPQALLSGSIPPSITALLARRLARVDTRIVVRQSNVIHIPGLAPYDAVRPRPRDPWARRLLGEAEAVIAISGGVADNFRRLTETLPAKIHTILGGIDSAYVQCLGEAESPHPWLDDPQIPVILNVGRLVPKKDQATLLHAFARVRRERPARLLIVGPPGPALPELDRLVTTLGLTDTVAMPGHSDNPYAYMARAAVFVLSSVSEGMTNTLLEALACGCPVVSTDCPSGPREVLDDGRCGRLVPMRDPDRLAQAILASLDAPPAPQRARARATELGIERVAAAYAEVMLATAAQPM